MYEPLNAFMKLKHYNNLFTPQPHTVPSAKHTILGSCWPDLVSSTSFDIEIPYFEVFMGVHNLDVIVACNFLNLLRHQTSQESTMTLDTIKRNLHNRRYRRLDVFQDHMFQLFGNARKGNRTDCEVRYVNC